MASELDRIEELLDAKEFAGARARLDSLPCEGWSSGELGRCRAFDIGCLLGQNAWDVANDLLAATLAQHGSDPDFACTFVPTLSGLGSCASAEHMISQLEALHDYTHLAGTLLLGVLFLQIGEPGFAGPPLRHSFRHCPEHDALLFMIRRNLAVLEEDTGYPDAAIEEYRAILRDRRADPTLWRDLARCERLNGDPGAAVEAMERYVELAPEDPEGWASLGDYQDDDGRVEATEASWQRALALEPTDSTIHYNRGVAAGRLRDLDRVRESIAALRHTDPDAPFALALDSILQEADGDIAGGWESMCEAVRRTHVSDSALALAHRALLYAERNEIPESAATFLDWAHARNLIDEDLLEVTNRIQHRRSEWAHDFSIELVARPNPNWCSNEALDSDGKPTLHYVRVLRVFADTGEEAWQLAHAFERRCGATVVDVQDICDHGPLEEGDWVGVWRCEPPEVIYHPERD